VKSKIEMNVPRYNYANQLTKVDEEIIPKFRDSLLSGQYVLTSEVNTFEESFAEYCGSKYGIGVNSGLDALTLSFMALSVGSGDEVITVANTFHATVLAIVRVGATPVLVDCDPDSYLMDIDQLKSAITPRTKAIAVVHLFGKAQNMTDIMKIAEEHKLYIVEDACQSMGAFWQGKRVGSIGTLGCFSFHPSKNLAAAGDAGLIVTNDCKLKDHLIQLRYFGQAAPNHHDLIGWNTKLDTLQAIVLNSKLPQLDRWNSLRFQKAKLYQEILVNLPIEFQSVGEINSHVYHLFQIKISMRDKLFEYLKE
jgi:dTDP-4-amino-4,6-dideoxygalactose transaminase